ncbi:hypothetical protein Cadr_000010040 [Camelus dromedarius]|uniref:Uncharacterized protein n=1 Tax=Camelus dromedarius TaxID=9838 RepID=A0A5N4DW11_CAMDR|nr:hypothetical protein Cadr_000010040 [Camelus dromedarius]
MLYSFDPEDRNSELEKWQGRLIAILKTGMKVGLLQMILSVAEQKRKITVKSIWMGMNLIDKLRCTPLRISRNMFEEDVIRREISIVLVRKEKRRTVNSHNRSYSSNDWSYRTGKSTKLHYHASLAPDGD